MLPCRVPVAMYTDLVRCAVYCVLRLDEAPIQHSVARAGRGATANLATLVHQRRSARVKCCYNPGDCHAGLRYMVCSLQSAMQYSSPCACNP